MTGSILSPNPANQGRGESGGTVIVGQSGALAVRVVGSATSQTNAGVVGSVGSDDVGVSSDALVSQSLNYGYNIPNGQWARQHVVAPVSGNGFPVSVKPHESPTFIASVKALTITSGGGKWLNIYHVSGDPIVKIKGIQVRNVASTTQQSGETMFVHVSRITWNPAGGSSISATPFDARNNESGVALNIMSNPTNYSGTGAVVLNDFITTNRGSQSIALMQSGVSTLGILQSLLQMNNWAPNAGMPGTQDFTLSSGIGIAVGQDPDNPVAGSGRVSVHVVYTVEAPWQ